MSDPAPAAASLGSAAVIAFSSQAMPDVFEQTGGGETVTTATFALINGDLVVRLPGYDFPIKIPAASWERMTTAQKGAFIKLMTEFSQSPELVSFFNHLQSEGASVVEVHELFTLAELDIVSIGLERSDIHALKLDDEANQILGTSVFRTSDGETGQVGDVALFVALRGSDCGCHANELSGAAATEMLHVQFEGLIP